MISEDRAPEAKGGRKRAVSILYLAVLVIVLAVLGGLAWYRLAPSPPMPDMAGLDPEVAEAIVTARSAVRWWPWSAERWGRLGLVLFAHNLNDDALVCLGEAEKLDASDVRWPYYQGLLLLRERPDAGLPCFERAAALKPTPLIRQRLAEALLRQDRLEEAEAALRQLLAADPGNARAVLGLGQIAMKKRDWRAAVSHFSQVTASPEVRSAAHRYLADAREQLGEVEAAKLAMKRAGELPDDPPVFDPFEEEANRLRVGVVGRLARGSDLLAAGKRLEGLQLLEETAQKYPDYLHTHLYLGRIYLKERDFDNAERHLREALRLQPGSTAALVFLGRILEGKGQIDGALGQYREALRFKPDAFAAHYNIGECLLKKGDKSGALAAFREVVRIKPDLAPAYLRIASLLHESGHETEAMDQVTAALLLTPDDEQAKKLLDEIKTALARGGEPKDK